MILTKLHDYQIDALHAALPHAGFAFLGEQRTRKTLIVLSLIDHHKPDIVVIFGPKKATSIEWPKQLKQHLKIDWDCQWEFINYEGAKGKRIQIRADIRKWKKEGKSVFLVADEAHKLKRPSTWQSRLLGSLGYLVDWRVALTGTLISQGLEDVWGVFNFLYKKMLGNFGEFKARYVIFETKILRNKRSFPVLTGYQNEEELAKIIHTYSHRITFDEAREKMGKKSLKIIRKKLYFDLQETTRDIYNSLINDMEVELDNGMVIDAPLAITLALKLQQLAGGFLIQQTRIPGQKAREKHVVPIGKEKVNALENYLKRFAQDHKLVICAKYTHEMEEIGHLLSDSGRSYQVVAGKHDSFKGKEYAGNFDVNVTILQIQSGDVINLAAADDYIFYSWDHSYVNYEQAKFRIIDMDKDAVRYHYLMARGSVDDDIYNSVVKKKDLATLIIDKYRKGKMNIDKVVSNRLKNIREALSDPIPVHLQQTEEIQMAARKKTVTLVKKTPVKKVIKKAKAPVVVKKKVIKKKVIKKKVIKKKVTPIVVAKKDFRPPVRKAAPVNSVANFVSSAQLAEEYGIDSQQFRYRIRGRVKKPNGRFWRWVKDSKDLLKIRRVLDEAALENGETTVVK